MKRIVRFFLIVSFALITNASIGQGLLCGTPEDNRNEIEYQTKKKLLAKTSGIGTKSAVSPITVNVVFHIINNSVTPSHTSSMLSNLNNSFQGHNINFVKLCDNFTQSNNEDLPYAINIYIYESLAAPYAKAVGSIALYIGRPQSNTTSLPHEMGHCLNLFHTHHIFNCYELVNGSNCVTCGDYVCDTPADPGLYTNMYWVNSNCSYIGTFRDQNGSTYNPDTRNFMSYSIHTCRNRFTVEQGNRMYNSLNTLAVLAPVKSAPVIQGNNLFCTNATFTQTSPPDNTLISWYVTPSYLVSPSSGSGATANLTKVINGNGFITFINECYTLAPFAFHTGPYSSNDYPVTGPDYASCNQSVYYSVPNLPGTTSINWTWPSEWNYVSGQGTTQLALNTGSYSQYYNAVAAGVNNICGSSGSYAYRFTSVSPCYYLMASPNPAGEELTVTFAEATDSNPSGYLDHENEITLRNHNQELMFTVRSTKKKVIIPTKSLPSGLYILTVANNKGAEQKQILIEHN